MVTYIFIVKGELINVTRAWDKEKNLRPRQESNPWPPEHKEALALSNELRELITEFRCDRRPALCKDSGGHGFDSGRGLRLFLCPTLVSCWFIDFSHFIAELKIHHLYSLITRFLFAFRQPSPWWCCGHETRSWLKWPWFISGLHLSKLSFFFFLVQRKQPWVSLGILVINAMLRKRRSLLLLLLHHYAS